MNPLEVIARLLTIYLEKVNGIWWKLPAALMLFYNFKHRDQLMKNNLFDTYPCEKPQHKQRCKDPVVGRIPVGCFQNAKCFPFAYVIYKKGITVDHCIKHCHDNNHHYAGHDGCSKCYCGDYIPSSARISCQTEGNHYCDRTVGCRYWSKVKVYRTMQCTEKEKNFRTLDGTCNDLDDPAMGSRFYRFGRNVPLNETYEDNALQNPNPRLISNRLLRRKAFIPVKQVNLFAAAWAQFMVHDWFDHGRNSHHKITFPIPFPKADPIYSREGEGSGEGESLQYRMAVRRTGRDQCARDAREPMSYQNDVTHWWDGSQIYGSDVVTNSKLREFNRGKLKVAHDGWLPKDTSTNIDITGFNKNWWVGLSLLHNIFTREHNAICDMLMYHYPHWSDQKLYDTARLINVAVMVKIHTIEWSPAILNNTALRAGVYLNWGLNPGNEVLIWLKKFNLTVKLPSLAGSPKRLHGVPYSLTEEFVAVYRMHPLLPDYLMIKDISSGKIKSGRIDLIKYSFGNARRVIERYGDRDVIYTFGKDHPGALTLHNYPQALMRLKLPHHQEHGETIDLATIDILRDRERGVPRYNQFRRLLHLKPAKTIDDITTNVEYVASMKEIYGNDVEKVDLLIGCLAEEPRPDGFGFSETQFVLFLMMASRRIEADRFLTDDFNEKFYTEEGLKWIAEANMSQVLMRAFPHVDELPNLLSTVNNAFFPWKGHNL